MTDGVRLLSIAAVSPATLGDALRLGRPWLPEPHNLWLLQRLFFNTSFIAVTEADAAIGAVIAMLEHERRPLRLYIDQVAVDPVWRGHGTLGKLLAAAHVAGAEGGAEVSWLTCHPENPSNRLWGRHAYEPVASADYSLEWPVHRDFKGPGEHRVLFSRPLAT